MKIALSSYSGYGAWFILRMLAEGHSVDYFLSESKYEEILGGLVQPKMLDLDHRRSLGANGYPNYSKYDVSVFDLTGRKKQADHSMSQCPTIGDGTLHSVLENDRKIGLSLMEIAGIMVPPYEEFTDINEARDYIKKNGKRYVFKPDGGQDQDAATTYVSKSAEDMLEYLDKVYALSKGVKFVLQEFIKGTECSVEGWFNGHDFYCLNGTLEDKKFMNDDIGPNTGCSGNLVFRLNSNSKIYKEGLFKVKKQLQEVGFRGMIDLNGILTETNLYGLEWTPRFGYDATATFVRMYSGSFGKLLCDVASGAIPNESFSSEFAVSARLSVPPYPTELRMPKLYGTPVKGLNPTIEEDLLRTYLYDVHVEKKTKLAVTGMTGMVLCPLELGTTPVSAFDALDARIKTIQIPDMQYRSDLKKSIVKRYDELTRMGWFDQ